MSNQQWWSYGLFINELSGTADDVEILPHKEIELQMLGDLKSKEDWDTCCALLGTDKESLVKFYAAGPTQRIPLNPDTPHWARPLKTPDAQLNELAVMRDWARDSKTSTLIEPLVQEVWAEIGDFLVHLDEMCPDHDIVKGALQKLLYVLDQNIACYSPSEGEEVPDPVEFWQSRPAALRHARDVAGAFSKTVSRFKSALKSAPSNVNLAALEHLFIEPLDMHRGGTTVVLAEGAGVLHPRAAYPYTLFSNILDLLQAQGMMKNWRMPQISQCDEGTWVEWIDGKDLNDLDENTLQDLAPDLAEFATIMWVLGATGIEPEGILLSDGKLVLAQIDGIIAPVLGKPDHLKDLKTIIGMFFDPDSEDDETLKLELTPACTARALSVFEHLPKVLNALGELQLSDGYVRTFIRPMEVYSYLLCNAPMLRDAGDMIAREVFFTQLRKLPTAFDDHDTLPLLKAEMSDLRQNNLPYATATPDGLEVFLSQNTSIGNLISQSGLDQAKLRGETIAKEAQHILSAI